MRAQDLEPEMEALLLRLVPGLEQQWKGATEHEIDQIEAIAGRPLPRFYRWFLMRLGHSMGPIAYPRLDFSAPKVLSCYAGGAFSPSSRFLMIGYESNEEMPLHVHYDFEYPTQHDARVIKGHAMGRPGPGQFDTFREMIAWGKANVFGVQAQSVRCVGMFKDGGGDVRSHLDPVMEGLGFEMPLATGPRCAIHLRSDAVMITSASLDKEPKRHVFRLGGARPGSLRRILGEIATSTALELEIDEWDPPL